MKPLTIVYSLPQGADVAALTGNPFAVQLSWSNAIAEANRQKAEIAELRATIDDLEAELLRQLRGGGCK